MLRVLSILIHTYFDNIERSDNFERTFWYPRILPKNERTNSFLVLLGQKTEFAVEIYEEFKSKCEEFARGFF